MRRLVRRAAAPSVDDQSSAAEDGVADSSSGVERLSIDEFRRRYLDGQLSLERWNTFEIDPADVPLGGGHPHTEAYRTAVMESWSRISGRSSYEPESDETFELDERDFLAYPYPYSSRDPVTISGYLGAVAHTAALIGAPPPARVLEFGSGWGHLALTLASSGYDVTAVDLNTASVGLLRRRAALLGVPLAVEQSGFLDFEASQPFDCVVFFEAFHHCHRPFELLDRCASMLDGGGTLVFVAEAFYDGFYAPWGMRLDGSATFMTAQQGWLELGFERSFIESELAMRGFETDWSILDHLGPYGTFLVARTTTSAS